MEAVRAAKIECILARVFVADAFGTLIHGIRSPQTGSLFTGYGILAAIGLLVSAVVCAVEFYGTHTIAGLAWEIGWGTLAAEFCRF